MNAYRARMMEEQWRVIERERAEAGLRPDIATFDKWWEGKR